jgi:hypothetical protein
MLQKESADQFRAENRLFGSYQLSKLPERSIQRLGNLTGGIPGQSSESLGSRSTSWARWRLFGQESRFSDSLGKAPLRG